MATHDTTRPIFKITEPIQRFSLLPVPNTKKRMHHTSPSLPTPVNMASSVKESPESGREPRYGSRLRVDQFSSLNTSTLQNMLTGSGSTLLSAAAGSAAAKGMNFLSSASSYLRDTDGKK